MEHGFLDKYAKLDSPIHNIDVRVKTAVIFILIFITALIPNRNWTPLLISFSFSLLIYMISRLPVSLLIKRLLLALPFIFSIGLVHALSFYNQAFTNFLFAVLKASTCVIFIVTFISTAEFTATLKALRFFKMPESLTSILSFFYRYVFVIYDEMERMVRARALRSSGAHRPRILRLSFALIGNLMLRSYERSERIYFAMKARGYSGKLPFILQRKLKANDYFSAFISILLIATLIYLGWLR